MALDIQTFSNVTGGNAFYKAIVHPLAAEPGRALIAELAKAGPVAVYDPLGLARGFASLYDLGALDIVGVYAQSFHRLDQPLLDRPLRPVTELTASRARRVLIPAFQAERAIAHIRHLLPEGAEAISLDRMRIPAELWTNPSHYLDPINFATNFAFFRDGDGHHTRLVTANYWAGYGAGAVTLWLRLFDDVGGTLATWRETLPAGVGSVVVDSREVRARFGLGPFTGQLFIHAVGAKGHDVVKYALDLYGDGDDALSCTHDANAWPSDLFAGLPAPRGGERVVLWLQNSHPTPIPSGSLGLNRMGDDRIVPLEKAIPPFGSYALDTAELMPDCAWPAQLELQAGKHLVRPRYEITSPSGRRRIAHLNVERDDLKHDPEIARLGNLMGKGFILPAPVLPTARWTTEVLPTPMSTAQRDLPITAIVYDADGAEITRHRYGRLDRADSVWLDMDTILNGAAETFRDCGGHVELVYDFADGGCADGWLHGIFRYADRTSGHAAETSFGAHVFNTVLTFRNEPQSYSGPAPGLSTRLFLRLGPAPLDTICHLIYPASTPWHPQSATDLVLHDAAGAEVAREHLAIPCSGSRHWRYHETFDARARARAGDGAYVVVRDVTCRLFGYHGLANDAGAFSLDHMFGF